MTKKIKFLHDLVTPYGVVTITAGSVAIITDYDTTRYWIKSLNAGMSGGTIEKAREGTLYEIIKETKPVKKYIKITNTELSPKGCTFPDGVILNKWYEVVDDSHGSYTFKNEVGDDRVVWKTDTSMYQICEGHPHADLIQYAADLSKETKDVGNHFQCYEPLTEKWRDCTNIVPNFNPEYKYRIKPKTIKIGDVEINAPKRESLKAGDHYYVPSLAFGCSCETWEGTPVDHEFLSDGLVFINKKDAITASKEMLKLLEDK